VRSRARGRIAHLQIGAVMITLALREDVLVVRRAEPCQVVPA
jgi:hypothetical protein